MAIARLRAVRRPEDDAEGLEITYGYPLVGRGIAEGYAYAELVAYVNQCWASDRQAYLVTKGDPRSLASLVDKWHWTQDKLDWREMECTYPVTNLMNMLVPTHIEIWEFSSKSMTGITSEIMLIESKDVGEAHCTIFHRSHHDMTIGMEYRDGQWKIDCSEAVQKAYHVKRNMAPLDLVLTETGDGNRELNYKPADEAKEGTT